MQVKRNSRTAIVPGTAVLVPPACHRQNASSGASEAKAPLQARTVKQYQCMRLTPNMRWINTGVAYNTATSLWPENMSNNRFVYPGGSGSALTTSSTLNFGTVCKNPNAFFTSRRASCCYVPEWAITNYIKHNFRNNTTSLNVRGEVVDDIKDQRTGAPAIYEEHMVGFDFWSGSTVTLCPELSYTHSFNPYGQRALDIQSGSSVSALQNNLAPEGGLPLPVAIRSLADSTGHGLCEART